MSPLETLYKNSSDMLSDIGRYLYLSHFGLFDKNTRRMSYQRFAFENLSPERQQEILEKQRKQQQLREMLQQQVQERKAEKDLDRERPERRATSFYRPQEVTTVAMPKMRPVSGPEMTFSVKQPLSRTMPLEFTKQWKLFSDRSPVQRQERPSPSMTLNPSKIHNAFENLRSRIITTASMHSVRGSAAMPMTFHEEVA